MAIYKKILKKGFENIGKNVKDFFLPEDINQQTEGLRYRQIEAINQRGFLSDLLMYRYYEEPEGQDKKMEPVGIYTQADGKRGFVLELSLPPYAGEKLEKMLYNLYSSFSSEGVVLHFNTFASKNLDKELKFFKELHPCDSNVQKTDMLKRMIDERAEYIERWTEESVVKGSEFRIRNFINTVSVIFPREMPVDRIITQCNNVKGSLSQLQPSNMPPERLVSVLKEFINPDSDYLQKPADKLRKLSTQIGKGSKVKLDRHSGDIKLGEKTNVRVFTTEKFPKHINLFDFTSIFTDPFGEEFQIATPCQFMVSLVIEFSDLKKKAKKVQSKARNYTKNLNAIPYTLEKQFPEIKDKKNEAEEILEHLKNNEIPLEAMFSIVLFEENMQKLNQFSSMLKKKFNDIPTSWILKEEDFSNIALFSVLYSLPLQYIDYMHDILKRMEILFKSNNAAITPAISDHKGIGGPVLDFLGRSGQFQAFNILDSKQNYNMTIVGPPGSGKSTLSNNIQLMHLASSWMVRMIDLGDSYAPLSESIGGQYLKFKEDVDICLNFFTNIKTKEVTDENGETVVIVHEDELITIIPLVGYMAGMRLVSSADSSAVNDTITDSKVKAVIQIIEEAIQESFNRRGHNAGMKEVGDILREFSDLLIKNNKRPIAELLEYILIALRSYTDPKQGKFFRYFNGAFNVNFDNDHFILELEELTKKGELLDIVVLGVLQRVASEAFFNRERNKLIGIDEAAPLLRNPIVVNFLDSFSRRIRKYGGILLILTQYLQDFFVNNESKTLYEGASFKLFLQQSEDSIEEASNKGYLNMNDFDIDLMKTVKYKPPHYSEFMLKYLNTSFVCRFKMTPFQYAMFTTKNEERQRIKKYQQNYKLSQAQATSFFAYKISTDLDDEEILEKVRSVTQNNSERVEEIKEKISLGLQNNYFIPFLLPIMNSSGKVVACEQLVKLKDGDKYINAGDFVPIAIKNKFYNSIIRGVMTTTFNEMLENDNLNISINISKEEIESNFFETFVQKIKEGSLRGDRFIFEFDSLLLKDSNFSEIMMEKIEMIKNVGSLVAFDKIGVDINISHLIRYSPDIIKIATNLIKRMAVDIEAREYVELLVLLSKKLNYKTVAVHIHSRETLEKSLELGIDFYQGFYLADSQSIFEYVEPVSRSFDEQ